MSTRRNLVRTEILTHCYGYVDLPRSAEQMVKTMRVTGALPDVTVVEIEEESGRLVAMGYLAEKRVEHAPGEKRWVLTGEGTKYVEQSGLV